MSEGIAVRVNKVYRPMYLTKARYILLYGGRAGGRSYAGVQYFIIKSRSPEYFRGYFMREVFGDIRESLWRDFNDMIEDLGIKDEYQLIDNSMIAIHRVTGNRIISKGFKKSSGNQSAKLKSIAGATHVLIEEMDEVKEPDFDKLDDSLRTTKAAQLQVIGMFNPEDENSWINKRWFTNNRPNNDPDLCTVHATYKDNEKNINSDTVRKLESYKKTNPEYCKVFTLGLWGGGPEGRVFEGWQKIDVMPDYPRFYGLDFGFTNDPTALVEMCIHNQILYVNELIYQTGLTNQELAKKIKDFGIKQTEKIFADSAEPKSIRELQVEGLFVAPAQKGRDSVRHGINFIKGLRGVYVTERSKNIWHENKYYVWKTDKNGNPTNQPIDSVNHTMDAIRYGLSQLIKPARKTSSTAFA